jgi:hypothetical protein
MYRIKHIPTGMYYVPVKTTTVHGWHVKTNLHKNGKVYFNKPTAKGSCSHGYNNHMPLKSRQLTEHEKGHGFPYNVTYMPYVESDWVVEKMK